MVKIEKERKWEQEEQEEQEQEEQEQENMTAATVCITRYNNKTWAERTAWLAANPGYACIYKSPVAIKSDIPYEASLFVLEMNNDTNRIMGVGRIVNEIRADRGYRIYEDQNYNRYTYLGRQRLDRDVIMQSSVHARVLETLERMLFYGSRHAKRGHGIHELPVRIRKNRPGFSFTHFFAELFSGDGSAQLAPQNNVSA
jgi:hypothetical protein